MSRCIHVYSFVARNHGGIPFSGVCPNIIIRQLLTCRVPVNDLGDSRTAKMIPVVT